MSNLIQKLTSRKLGVTAVIGIATAAGSIELTWPMAAVVIAYILGQAYVDAKK